VSRLGLERAALKAGRGVLCGRRRTKAGGGGRPAAKKEGGGAGASGGDKTQTRAKIRMCQPQCQQSFNRMHMQIQRASGGWLVRATAGPKRNKGCRRSAEEALYESGGSATAAAQYTF